MYFKEENNFKVFLKNKKLSDNYIRDILMNCNKVFSNDIFSIKDLISYYEYNLSKYSYLCLRNWISFCDDNDFFNNEIILLLRKKIKRKSNENIDIYVPKRTEIKDFLDFIYNYDILSYIYVRILYESGLRICEINYIITNWDKNKAEVENNIFIYPIFYKRGCKNSYYLFATKETYDLFEKNINKLKLFKISKLTSKIYKEKLLALKYFRKYHFTLMIQSGIEFEIGNFIQGRSSKNIGFNHYLAKKEIAIKEYSKIINKF